MKEIWKDIKGYEELYQVSNFGNIRSLDKYVNSSVCGNGKRLIKGKILKHTLRSGYPTLNLTKNNKRKGFQIHRLVAQTFMPNINKTLVVNHKDFNRKNNQLDNLEWCTQKYNINYSKERMSKPKDNITSNTGEKYISYKKRGSIKNGKSYYYMYYCLNLPKEKCYKVFKTLDEAIKYRNYFLKK